MNKSASVQLRQTVLDQLGYWDETHQAISDLDPDFLDVW